MEDEGGEGVDGDGGVGGGVVEGGGRVGVHYSLCRYWQAVIRTGELQGGSEEEVVEGDRE